MANTLLWLLVTNERWIIKIGITHFLKFDHMSNLPFCKQPEKHSTAKHKVVM